MAYVRQPKTHVDSEVYHCENSCEQNYQTIGGECKGGTLGGVTAGGRYFGRGDPWGSFTWPQYHTDHTVYSYCVAGHPSCLKHTAFRRLDSVSVFRRPSELRIKEHNHNLTGGLLEQIELSPTCVRKRPQNSSERSEPNTTYRKYQSRSQTTTTPSSVDWVGKLCLYVDTTQRIYLSSDYFYSDSTLVLGLTFVDFLMFVLTLADGLCCAWFIYIPTCVGFHLKTEAESSIRNVVF
jgi:hypothetical protein